MLTSRSSVTVVSWLAIGCVVSMACRIGEEPRVDVEGPSIVLSPASPRADHVVHACVPRDPPDEGIVIDVEADARLVHGEAAEVTLYVEMGDALFDAEDGDTTVSPVFADSITFEQRAGMSTASPDFDAWCDVGLDVAFELVSPDATVEVDWRVAVFTVGGFPSTKLEVRIEE